MTLPHDLTAVDVRILGSLIEKQLSTPDHYPLSLNALTSACNQVSNRDPVMSLGEGDVSEAITGLRRRGLVRSIQSVGSRVAKFEHLLVEAGELTPVEVAVLGVLMLRGPQTQAEVRTRSERLVPREDPGAIDAALEALVGREPPIAARLPRRPGQKEARCAHLLAGEVTDDAEDAPVAVSSGSADRVAALEEAVRELQGEVADLRSQLGSFRRQFE